MSDIKVTCPECGSEKIIEKNEAYAEFEVLEWEHDEATGMLSPLDYDMVTSPDWEVADVAKQYRCNECGLELSIDDLSEHFNKPAAPAGSETDPNG